MGEATVKGRPRQCSSRARRRRKRFSANFMYPVSNTFEQRDLVPAEADLGALSQLLIFDRSE